MKTRTPAGLKTAISDHTGAHFHQRIEIQRISMMKVPQVYARIALRSTNVLVMFLFESYENALLGQHPTHRYGYGINSLSTGYPQVSVDKTENTRLKKSTTLSTGEKCGAFNALLWIAKTD
ncbi:MAG: hypothetical protein OQK24_01920 [Magnetovibrio sp.]|nr:hypothetical protein [Magnetovibrio sp.]